MSCFLDLSDFPVALTVLEGDAEEAEVLKLVDEMYAMQDRRQRFASVNDLSKFRLPSVKIRKILKDYSENSEWFCEHYVVCMATVIENTVMRFAMEAVNAFRSTSYPMKFFKTRQEAIRWSKEMLRKEGLV